MPPEPPPAHETPEFQNAVEYVVTVTFTVAGGARRGTAERRAERVAERLANAAARAAGVVAVSAVTGLASGADGGILVPRRVRFAAANTGHGAYGDPHKLNRYLDPEHERALASLRAANAAYRARQDADRQRRQALGCANAHRVGLFGDRRSCECVYCRPQDHLSARELAASAPHLFPHRRACAPPPHSMAAGACTTATSSWWSSTVTPRRCSSWPRRQGGGSGDGHGSTVRPGAPAPAVT